MPYLLNLVYLLLLVAISPWLVYKAITTGKYRKGMLQKLLGLTPLRGGIRPCVWFHAVSVGEVLLLKQVIARFRQRWPEWDCVLSTTTNTGFDVATKTYPDLAVFYWPLDFTWAVNQALRRIRPQLVVLAELELWPNFVLAAKRQGCPVVVINGRMSPRSYRGYRRLRWLMAHLLAKIDLFAVQNQDYAERLLDLGAPADRLHVTGSVKYDGVNTNRDNPKTQELACLVGLGGEGRGQKTEDRGQKTEEGGQWAAESGQRTADSKQRTTDNGQRTQLVWIVGSTQDPEERIALDIYRRARERFPNLRLILVPRHKERFDEVARLLESSGLPFLRRSQITTPDKPSLGAVGRCAPYPIVLLDTLGELGAAWGLADVAFVGGSLSQRGGQNMIEPAAYGAAVMFGPHVWNFQETVDRLLEHQAAVQVPDAVTWERETLRLLEDAEARSTLGQAARRFVLSQQGATDRTLLLLGTLLHRPARTVCAA